MQNGIEIKLARTSGLKLCAKKKKAQKPKEQQRSQKLKTATSTFLPEKTSLANIFYLLGIHWKLEHANIYQIHTYCSTASSLNHLLPTPSQVQPCYHSFSIRRYPSFSSYSHTPYPSSPPSEPCTTVTRTATTNGSHTSYYKSSSPPSSKSFNSTLSYVYSSYYGSVFPSFRVHYSSTIKSLMSCGINTMWNKKLRIK